MNVVNGQQRCLFACSASHWQVTETPFAVSACDSSLSTSLRDMVKALISADAVAEATAGIQRDLAARLAEHGESECPSTFQIPYVLRHRRDT